MTPFSHLPSRFSAVAAGVCERAVAVIEAERIFNQLLFVPGCVVKSGGKQNAKSKKN
jgi:hypothetical protein